MHYYQHAFLTPHDEGQNHSFLEKRTKINATDNAENKYKNQSRFCK